MKASKEEDFKKDLIELLFNYGKGSSIEIVDISLNYTAHNKIEVHLTDTNETFYLEEWFHSGG